MAETIKLMNLKRRMRVFNLEHPTFRNTPGENGAGKPETLTIEPRQAIDVHPDVLECVEIKKALRPSKGRPTLRVLG